MRAVARVARVSFNTVAKMLREAADAADAYHDRQAREAHGRQGAESEPAQDLPQEACGGLNASCTADARRVTLGTHYGSQKNYFEKGFQQGRAGSRRSKDIEEREEPRGISPVPESRQAPEEIKKVGAACPCRMGRCRLPRSVGS